MALVGHCGYIRLYPANRPPPRYTVTDRRGVQHPLLGFSLLAILRRNQRENPPPNPLPCHPSRRSPSPLPVPSGAALATLSSSTSDLATTPLSAPRSPSRQAFSCSPPPLGIPYRLPACRGMHLSGRLSTYLSRCTGCPSENQLPFLRSNKRGKRELAVQTTRRMRRRESGCIGYSPARIFNS